MSWRSGGHQIGEITLQIGGQGKTNGMSSLAERDPSTTDGWAEHAALKAIAKVRPGADLATRAEASSCMRTPAAMINTKYNVPKSGRQFRYFDHLPCDRHLECNARLAKMASFLPEP